MPAECLLHKMTSSRSTGVTVKKQENKKPESLLFLNVYRSANLIIYFLGVEQGAEFCVSPENLPNNSVTLEILIWLSGLP